MAKKEGDHSLIVLHESQQSTKRKQKKYAPTYSPLHKNIAVFQFVCLNIFIYVFLALFSKLNILSQLSFGLLILTTIFGFTSFMDGHKWAFHFEICRSIIGLVVILYPMELNLWNIQSTLAVFSVIYYVITLLTTLRMYSLSNNFMNDLEQT